ncbi:DEKNAAC102087 [Brettanomyces naardenensis]|uniref:DEKNAAC102087 n=1 Tax=Brettanomyces naardenensis TaxID=13370 RepID=A0A448YJQ2_BRENA|nr:DEKNAAC102087 [Brettanomyces naardenensis]
MLVRHKDTSNRTRSEDSSPSPSTLSLNAKRSETILSPHSSVLNVLHNPELDIDPPMGSPADLFRNNEFSFTSWQSISPDPLRLGGFPLNSSPNVGSILSSSSDPEERAELNAYDDRDATAQLTSQNANNPSPTSNVVILRPSSPLDEDYENISSDLSDENGTLDSSTIIPSFVMPRVSIPTLDSTTDNAPLNIQIVGEDNHSLISRLSNYRKTLGNVTFQSSNQPAPKLILIILNQDNYLLPRIVQKPFIPILLESRGASASIPPLDRLSNQYMVCKPLHMRSLSDDLTVLIDFLSGLDRNCALLNRLLDNGRIGYSMKLNTVNSVLIESSSSDFSKAKPIPETASSSSSSSSSDGTRKRRRERDFEKLRAKLFFGFAFGVVSLTIIVIWRELTSTTPRQSAQELVDSNGGFTRIRTSFISFSEAPFYSFSSTPEYDPIPTKFSGTTDLEPWQKYMDEWNDFMFLRLDCIAEEISSLGRLLIQRAKLAFLNLLSIFG